MNMNFGDSLFSAHYKFYSGRQSTEEGFSELGDRSIGTLQEVFQSEEQ